MSDDQITNGRRAARDLDAINMYARMSSSGGLPESYFFFDFEREPEEQSGDHDRLSGLVCGLMHYAERRSLSFAGALTDTRRQYDRQRTNYAPEDGMQLAGQTQRAADTGSAPLTGEIVTARPGDPPVYLVEFITSREWVPEPDLAPARPFPPIAASDGVEICSAYVARYCMVKAIRRIEASGKNDRSPAPADARDLDIFLTALCGWSGLERPVVLRSISTVLTEQDGQLLVAAPQGPHPVALAVSGVASPPETSLPADAIGTTAALPRPAAQGQLAMTRRADARRAESGPGKDCGRHLRAIGGSRRASGRLAEARPARLRGFTPGEQRPGHLTGTIRRDSKLMNIHATQNEKAAQQIIKALALPTASRAPVAPRPMPLSHLPRLPRETSMLYTIGRVDRSGRVTNRGITDALRWQPGDRLAMTLTPSAVVLYPAPDGLLRVPPRPCIAIPVTARRLLSITPGDELLLAAAPEYRIVITHTMQAVEDMLTSFYAQIAADEFPQP